MSDPTREAGPDQSAGVASRRWLEIPSPFRLEPGSLRLLEPECGLTEAQRLRIRQGKIEQPFIIDTGRTRKLFFSLAAIQSTMALDDPDALVTPYLRKMMAFLLWKPAPRHVLMMGLGGGSLAKFCYRHLPRTRITVLEINAEVIALREAFAIPRDDDRFRVIHADAADYLDRPGAAADVILLDAFDRAGIACSLESSSFYPRLVERLNPRGLLVMNFSGQKTRYPLHVRHICQAFGTAVRVLEVSGEDNVLLLASRGSLVRFQPILADRALALEACLGLPFRHYLARLRGSSLVRVAA